MRISRMKAVTWTLVGWSCMVLVCADAFASHRPLVVLPNSARSPLLFAAADGEDFDVSKDQVVDGNQQAETGNGSNSAEDIPRGGANIRQTPPPKPTFAEFQKFALPCLGLWVAQPLLSLVDTAFVGLSGDASTSASQLAALGPATTFFDGATYLFAFLNVATTNLYSSARAQRGELSDKSESVVRTASRVATRCGIGIFVFLMAFSRPLLALYIGNEAASTPGLLDSATAYVKIRAFSLPTSLFGGVIQAALLGGQDSVTPLVAILYSTIINVVGDFLLVKQFGMGLKGAATATLVAQLVATAALVNPARRKLVRDGSFGILKKAKITSESVSGRSFLAFAAPVLTLILGKLAAFGFLTNAAAGVPGQPTPLASHQIILSLFFFASPFLEVISQTAQTFIPAFLAPVGDHVAKMKKKNPKYKENTDSIVTPWKNAAFDVGTRLLRLGFVSGTVVATLASLIPFANAGILTSDPSLKAAVKPLAKYLWMGAFLTAPVAVSEGILLARRELKFLASVYLVSTALLPPSLLRVKMSGGTVEQVWACFAIFQLFRAICFAGKIWAGPVTKRMASLLGFQNASTKLEGKNAIR